VTNTASSSLATTPKVVMSEVEDEKSVSEHEQLDWEGLRKLSLVPGGFGEARTHVW
jgi:hypothetical protein